MLINRICRVALKIANNYLVNTDIEVRNFKVALILLPEEGRTMIICTILRSIYTRDINLEIRLIEKYKT